MNIMGDRKFCLQRHQAAVDTDFGGGQKVCNSCATVRAGAGWAKKTADHVIGREKRNGLDPRQKAGGFQTEKGTMIL